jgi:hypothetical protein
LASVRERSQVPVKVPGDEPEAILQFCPPTHTSFLVCFLNVVEPEPQPKSGWLQLASGVNVAVTGNVAFPFHLIVILADADPGMVVIVSTAGLGETLVILKDFGEALALPTVPSCRPTPNAATTIHTRAPLNFMTNSLRQGRDQIRSAAENIAGRKVKQEPHGPKPLADEPD